jgi:HSP20 family protein
MGPLLERRFTVLTLLNRQSSNWPARASAPIDWLDREFGRTVRSFLGDGSPTEAAVVYPANIWEDDDNVYIEAELPGFTKDEVNVTMEQGTLTIAAERNEKNPQPNGSPVLTERTWSRYVRTFSIPASVQEDNVTAKCENGVLHLRLPKRPEVKPRKIKIQ